jgi:RHS repeat-associated protein
LVSHTDFNGQTTTFSYDPNNDQLLSINYALGLVESFTYDVLGNRLIQTFPDGTNTYTYDNRHRLVKEVKHNNAILEYGYDNVGNRTSLSFTPPNGATVQVQYQYDALSRLQKVIANNGETTYSYDPVGNRQQVTYPNGTHTQYAYDSLNRLLSLEASKPDNSLLASYQYTLAPTGHRTKVVEHSGRVVDYTYDDLYRLTEEKITDGGETIFSYQYDAVGNRVYSIEDGVHTQYTYDANDRLLTQGGATYQYDANGNNIRISEEGNVVRMAFDGDNRLVSVETEENGQVTSSVSYAYDADGNRVQTAADGQVTQYVVDGNAGLSQVIAELDENNQLGVSYLHGDDLISQSRDSAIHFYHYDGLGSTRALSSQTATVTDSYDYEAFGELLGQTGSTENNYLYTGEQIEPNTGNYYLRSRFYNPGSGLFLSMDSFDGLAQDPVTLHKYLYAHACPTNYTDPSGKISISIGGLSIAQTMVVLTTISIASYQIGQSLTGGGIGDNDGLTSIQMGWLILAGMVANSGVRDLITSKVDAREDSDDTIDLFRAVEDVELAAMYTCQCFSLGPNGFPKQFFHSSGEAMSFGNQFIKVLGEPRFHIVKATIWRRLYNSLDHSAYEPGIGPIVTVPNPVLPAFNIEVDRNGGWQYLGTY